MKRLRGSRLRKEKQDAAIINNTKDRREGEVAENTGSCAGVEKKS